MGARSGTEQANTVRLAPSTPKHKREGHANSSVRDRRAHRPRIAAPASLVRNTPDLVRIHAVRPLRIASSMNAGVNHDRVAPSPAVKASISSDGLVLLDMSGGLVLSSNNVGARIWQLIEERQAQADIVKRLAGEYAIPIDRAERDVATFVAALMARGLVVAEVPR